MPNHERLPRRSARTNLCNWFAGKGVYEAFADDLVDELWSSVPS